MEDEADHREVRAASGGGGGPSGARRHRLELDPLDERRRVAEHRRDALAHRGGFGRGARGTARLDEHPVHAAPDVGGDALHTPADIDGALLRFAPCGVLERADPRAVGDERHRAQRDDREQQEGDDQPGTESHYLSSLQRPDPAEVRCSYTVRRKEHGSCHGHVLKVRLYRGARVARVSLLVLGYAPSHRSGVDCGARSAHRVSRRLPR